MRAPLVTPCLRWTLALLLISSGLNAATGAGPIAITMAEPPGALVLRADGRVLRFDTSKALFGGDFYRVPTDFVASDMSAAFAGRNLVVCLMLNRKSPTTFASFLLQLFPNKKQVWTMMPQDGVYVGVAVDSQAEFAFVTNSTNNGVYRVSIGNEKGQVSEVARIPEASMIAAIALDETGKRLFVGDAEGQIYTVSLGPSSHTFSVPVHGLEEIRALAWNQAARRLFVADAGQEAVWSIDPDQRGESTKITDGRRFREPSGLMVGPDGHVWGVDEGTRTVFQIPSGQRSVGRSVKVE